jgi:hypothetical protein
MQSSPFPATEACVTNTARGGTRNANMSQSTSPCTSNEAGLLRRYAAYPTTSTTITSVAIGKPRQEPSFESVGESKPLDPQKATLTTKYQWSIAASLGG